MNGANGVLADQKHLPNSMLGPVQQHGRYAAPRLGGVDSLVGEPTT